MENRFDQLGFRAKWPLGLTEQDHQPGLAFTTGAIPPWKGPSDVPLGLCPHKQLFSMNRASVYVISSLWSDSSLLHSQLASRPFTIQIQFICPEQPEQPQKGFLLPSLCCCSALSTCLCVSQFCTYLLFSLSRQTVTWGQWLCLPLQVHVIQEISAHELMTVYLASYRLTTRLSSWDFSLQLFCHTSPEPIFYQSQLLQISDLSLLATQR